MRVLLLLQVPLASLLMFVSGQCPPSTGIYLMHGGYCLPKYTVVGINSLTAANPLHCILAGSSSGTGGGQWTGPDNTPVQCGGSGSGPLTCSQSLDPTNITLYNKFKGGAFLGKQLYTCTISGQSISVHIKLNQVQSAIYIEPPADVMSVPQNYTVHCITTGFNNVHFTVELTLENMYYNNSNNAPPVSGYNRHPDHSELGLFTYDYSEEVVWRADTVVVDGTEFSDQGLTKYNGDHDWACHVHIKTGGGITGGGIDVVQTYIRAPNFTPTNLAIVHKNATGVTISWTAVNASDADGYIVNITLLSSANTNNPTLVDVGNVTQYTLQLSNGTTFQLTVRAYQDLLGPASTPINIIGTTITNVVIQPLQWLLLSNRTSPEVKYHVYCKTKNTKPGHIIWRMNGTIIVNSSFATISHQLLDTTINKYTNILTVTGDHRTQTISCAVKSGTVTHNKSIVIQAPSNPPVLVGVTASINSSTSATVRWSPPVGGANGYVILYSANGASNMSGMTQLVKGGNKTSSILTGLSWGQIYAIRMFAYKDLPSMLSDTIFVQLNSTALPHPVSRIIGKPITPSSISVSWTQSIITNGTISPVSQYIITYFNITCPSEQHFTDNGSVAVNSPLTSTLIPLQSGQLYNISVRASNAVGVSPAVSGTFWTPASEAPSASPEMINVSSVRSSSIDVSWGEVPCPHRNGEITGYVIMYKQKGVKKEGRQASRQTQEDMIMVDNHTATIDDLDPLTEYSVMVAGVNSAGTGQFSEPVTVITEEQSSGLQTAVVIGGAAAAGAIIIILVILFVVVILLMKFARKQKQSRCSDLTNLTGDGEHIAYYNIEKQPECTDMDGGYVYATVNKQKNKNEAEIPTTLPVSLAELSDYVEGCHDDSNKAFYSQFEELHSGDIDQITVGFSREHIHRNRFKNITTYDNSRVVLQPMEGYTHDFVNASYVDGYSSRRKFIASQGPTKQTLVDFWRLVWQERPQCIVMVTNVVEEGKTKCEQYWPSREEGSQTFGPFDVSLLNEVTLPDYTVRTLEVCVETNQSTASMTVTQYHFTSWPDHGVPQYGSPLMMVHKKVMAGWKRGGPPIIVHCSAGVGRTGTFITIDIALEQAEKKGVVDIAGIINRLREQRMLMVQTVQQYIFLHDAILEHVICGQTEVPSDKLQLNLAKLRRIDPTTGKSMIQDQFELLAKLTADPNHGILTTALNNFEKNRTHNYLPNECWRVPLEGEYPGYINASFVNGYREKKTFIIAQCPMENTVRDFWKMVVDYRIPVVVMLCDLSEDNTLCHYWPKENEALTFGEFYTETLSEVQCDGFVRHNIKITLKEQNKAHDIALLQVTMWPPRGVANSPGCVIALMDTVVSIRRKKKKGPLVVQCSDTVSRSGMYCAISNALEQCKAEGVVDVFQTVKGVRMQKPGAVTTQEQYNFIFDVVVAFLNSYDNYANFAQL